MRVIPESKEIYETLSAGLVVHTALQVVTLAPRVIVRCNPMSKGWPWHEFEA